MERLFFAIMWAVSLVISSQAQAAATINPESLLIYYGWPSSINKTYEVSKAAAEFSRYQHAVIGDGLQDPAHGDHANTKAIIAGASANGTRFYGYIDLGVTTQNLSLDEIAARVQAWQAMGVVGILLDDFGYDFNVTRDRQNAAVELIQQAGLSVIANAWHVDDVFATTVDAVFNPNGTATKLGANDFYLFESHQIKLGAAVSRDEWLTKAQKLAEYQVANGIRVMSVTTSSAPTDFSGEKFAYSWLAAAMFEHAATGWGEPGFAAQTAEVPFRQAPAVTIPETDGDIIVRRKRVVRKTPAGWITINTDKKTARFRGR